jgi:hypothetical protein
MDDDSRATIAYLQSLPAGATVRWASDHLTLKDPFATGWVDVRIPDGGPPDMSWVWTILRPDDPDQGEPDQLWQFPWPQDVEIHSVFDPYSGRGGWSARTVCDALACWTARHAGRADLRFEWAREAGPSPVLELVMERAAADGPVWDLGDGLKAVDGLMDDLLALHPDEAARMTVILREAGSRFRGGSA